jgi:hypothetical protein
MLRITTEHRDRTVVLRLEGRLQGPWIDELRECWQRAREASGETVQIELVDVSLINEAGKALLTEMHRAGVEVLAHGPLTKAIRDEIVAGARRGRTAR